ncbi:MAG: DUF1697 domain-containing protein [Flavobacteriaceae bacterium]
MKTYIALLRGINVGGHKKVPMAELRELLTNSGFKNVQTYIQSGNVVFQFQEANTIELENKIAETIQNHFGFEVLVLVKTRPEINCIFNDCPFAEEKKSKSYFMLLHDLPDKELITEASTKTYDGEEYQIIKDCIYYYCEKGYGQAKFNMNFFEKKLNTFATSRNYNTMVKLLSLSKD